MALCAVVPTHNTRDLTLACLEKLHQTSRIDRPRIIVVDDGSDDGTEEAILERFPETTVFSMRARAGFTCAVNAGLERVGGADAVLILNSDTEVLPGSLATLCQALARDPRLGIAGAELLYPDGRPQWSSGRDPDALWLFLQASGLLRGLRRRAELYRRVRPLHRAGATDWVPATAMAIRRAVLEQVGGFDPRFRLYCQDTDYCRRARDLGWKVAVVPGFRVLHHHGATVRQQLQRPVAVDPRLLWTDLLAWTEKHRGERSARFARLAMRLGAACHLLGRRLAAALGAERFAPAWRAETDLYREAAAALRAWKPGGTPS